MDFINDMRVAITVASFLVFIGIVIWAWSGQRKRKFDEAARLPLEEDDPPAAGKSTAPEQHSIEQRRER